MLMDGIGSIILIGVVVVLILVAAVVGADIPPPDCP
jgi:hypothetical protein